jgi:hypothetical protein
MTGMQKGIQLITDPEGQKNVFINTGVLLCDKDIPGKPSLQYDDNSYKPKEDWRALNSTEKKLLFLNGKKSKTIHLLYDWIICRITWFLC